MSRLWMPVKQAFEALGLKLSDAHDRKAWEYFASRHVRMAVNRDGEWIDVPGPYRVRDKSGRLVPLIVTSLDTGEAAVEYGLLVRDVENIKSNVPFLFDSIAGTALKVGTRLILRADAPKAPKKRTRRAKSNTAKVTIRRMREIVAYGSIPTDDPRKRQALANLLQPWRDLLQERSQRTLDAFANSPGASPGSINKDLDWLQNDSELVELLNAPWVFGKRSTVFVAPLFEVRDVRWIERSYQAHSWDVENVQRWKELEKLGRDHGDEAVSTELLEQVAGDILNAPIPSPLDPAFWGKVALIEAAIAESKDPENVENCAEPDIPVEDRWPEVERRSYIEGIKLTERSGRNWSEVLAYKPFLLAIFERIKSRQIAFLRAHLRDEFKESQLPRFLCCNPRCDNEVVRIQGRRGPTPKYCAREECSIIADKYEEARRKQVTREWHSRRHLK